MLPWIMLIPTVYIGGRYILTLPLPWWIKIILCLLVLMVAECHLIYKLVFGAMFAPEFPHSVMVVINLLFGSLLFFTAALLIRDLISLILFLFTQHWHESLAISHLLLLVSLILGSVGVWQAVRVPKVKTVTLPISGLPSQFAGYRLVQLTDLHASTLFNGHWMAQVVARTNQLQPDLILITGDIADGRVTLRLKDVAPLAQLSARQGVYAIPGNHEYYSNFQQWMTHIQSLGIHELINRSVTLKHQGAEITVAGVTDEAALRFGEQGPDLTQALADVDRSTTLILMDHRPGNAVENIHQGVDLQLSGHTHGGMVYGLDWIVKKSNQGFYSGLYSIAGKQLYVSNGTGLWNGFAQRLGYPSEITLFILQPAP